MKRRRSLRGTSLKIDPRTGNYIWRRYDETVGRRIERSTKTTNLTIALQIATKLEDEYQRRRVGRKQYTDWTAELAPLVEEWIASLGEGKNAETLTSRIRRAVAALKLRTPADLDDIPKLEKRLLALEGTPGPRGPLNRLTLRRGFQRPLKQFSAWLAENGRHLESDPLASWKPIDADVETRKRRAFLPEEVARALVAADGLDRLLSRKFPSRPIYLALLVAAPRVDKLIKLRVEDLDRKGSRLVLGAGVGPKRTGQAALDARTLEELEAYVGTRKGALFVTGKKGKPLEERNLLDEWREAFALGLVQELLAPKKFLTAYLVMKQLMWGRAPVSRGGNPTRVSEETIRAREEQAARTVRRAAKISDAWTERMKGVDLHAFRKTHRTWAELAGVHPIVIDRQLGHSSATGAAALDAARALLASATGRKHYVDMDLEIIDARRSAESVRAMLDEALAAIAIGGRNGGRREKRGKERKRR